MGEKLNDEDLNEVLAEANVARDGTVNYTELAATLAQHFGSPLK